MKKLKVFYLRNQRVGSSNFISALVGKLDSCTTLGSHQFYDIQKEEYKNSHLEKITKWENLHKVVSIKNPWVHHLSTFFRKNSRLREIKGYQKLGILPRNAMSGEFANQDKKTQNIIINAFRENVSSQYDIYKNLDLSRTNKGQFKNATIEQQILNGETPHRKAFTECYINWPIYTLNNEIMTSLSIKGDMPTLEKDLQSYLKLAGLEDCDHANNQAKIYLKKSLLYQNKKARFNYKDFYDKETKHKVGEIRAMEIEAHKYKF